MKLRKIPLTRAALEGAHLAMIETGIYRPGMISVTIEPMGTMLGGQSIEAVDFHEPFESYWIWTKLLHRATIDDFSCESSK